MWWLNILVILMWSCFKNQPPRSFLISWCITLWLRVWHLRGKWYEVWRVWEKVWLFQVRLPFGNLQEDIQVDVFCALYLGIFCFVFIGSYSIFRQIVSFAYFFLCSNFHGYVNSKTVTLLVCQAFVARTANIFMLLWWAVILWIIRYKTHLNNPVKVL